MTQLVVEGLLAMGLPTRLIQLPQKGTWSRRGRILMLCGLIGKQSKRICVQGYLGPYWRGEPKLSW